MIKKLLLTSVLLFGLSSVLFAGVHFPEGVNKFGRAPSGVQTTATDIWDLADATPTQQIWVAPTAARIHAIVSSSASDDGDPVGVGARTIRVYGLKTWASDETYEDITLNGAGAVNTVNSYVIIHRMKVLTKGATNVNVGNIKATAASDSSITAQINAGEGQTQMAIYGIPSTKSAYMTQYYASCNLAGTSIRLDVTLKINPEPDAELLNFLTKQTQNIRDTGAGYIRHEFNPPMKIVGPAIIKIQAISSVADSDGSAGFDLILVDN